MLVKIKCTPLVYPDPNVPLGANIKPNGPFLVVTTTQRTLVGHGVSSSVVEVAVDDDGVEMMMWCAVGGDDDDDGIPRWRRVAWSGGWCWGERSGGDAMIKGGVHRLWQPKVSPEMGDGGRKTWPEKGEAPETYGERSVCLGLVSIMRKP
ncbi:hypothetical protein Tco_0046828 [Tanacetum coccineum]